MLLHQPTASSPAQVHELPPPLRVLTTTSASRGAFPKLLLSPPKPFPACSSLKNPIPSLIQPLPRTTTPTCILLISTQRQSNPIASSFLQVAVSKAPTHSNVIHDSSQGALPIQP